MRILLVDTEDGWRGGQQQVLLLAAGLAHHPRFNNEAVVVAREGGELARRVAAAGLPCRTIPHASAWSPFAVWRLRRLAEELGADVLHAHASHAHTLCALATLGSHRHLVATRRVDFLPKGGWKYRRCSRVVAISQAIARLVIKTGVRPERLVVIPSGIDPGRFASACRERGRRSLGLAPDELAVLCVAALEDHKDHKTLLSAWSRMAHAHSKAWLLLAGDGGLRAAVAAQAAESPRVRLLGFRDDIPDLLAAADCVVLSSHMEGLGTALMDAMSCGQPVVATAAGGIPELIVDGQDGILVPPRDPAAFAESLALVISDGKLRQRLGAAAAATAVRRFHATAMVQAYVDLYDQVMRGA